jgi:hypothetical protein
VATFADPRRESTFNARESETDVAKLRFHPFVSRINHLSPNQGINETYTVTHKCHAKEWDPRKGGNSPWLLPNEWICANLAWFLRIDTPGFDVARSGSKDKGPKLFLTSLFRGEREVPPDLDPSVVWKALPDPCCAMLVFDILIANPDRHAGNLAVDDPDDPKTLIAFDHDQALFGNDQRRLADERDLLGFDQHFLRDVVEYNEECFKKWLGKVSSIPSEFMREVCHEPVCRKHFTRQQAREAYDFLSHRSERMYIIAKRLKGWAPRISRWPLLG